MLGWWESCWEVMVRGNMREMQWSCRCFTGFAESTAWTGVVNMRLRTCQCGTTHLQSDAVCTLLLKPRAPCTGGRLAFMPGPACCGLVKAECALGKWQAAPDAGT